MRKCDFFFVVYLTRIVPMKFNPRDENTIKAVTAKANVVINLIGTHSSCVILPIKPF